MITFWEHFSLFVLLSLLVTLVYSGLRQDDLKMILKLALRRFVFFMTASAVLGVAVYYFALAL
ncbi:MAG: hypothetical protein ACYTG7_08900 [Planctomycetota bacterium]|jgi:hypothetical protein